MTEGGHLPNSWADVAWVPSEQGLPGAGMIKPMTLSPLVLPFSI